MLRLTWVKHHVKHQSIGSRLLHLHHLLDLVCILFLAPNPKVWSNCFLISKENIILANPTDDLHFLVWLNIGSGSARSSIQLYQESDASTFDVGHEHLKLIFSSEEGKPTHYINKKSGVSYMHCGPTHYISFVWQKLFSFLWSATSISGCIHTTWVKVNVKSDSFSFSFCMKNTCDFVRSMKLFSSLSASILDSMEVMKIPRFIQIIATTFKFHMFLSLVSLI